MSVVADPVANDVEALQAELVRQRSQLEELNKRLAWYEEQRRLSQTKRFSASADTPPEQEALFNEAERQVHRERTFSIKGHQRRQCGGREPLPTHLPREVQVHELNDAECTCGCGSALHVVGTDVSEQLEQVPARLYVIEHHVRRYGCRSCGEGMKRTPAPAAPIRGARVGAQLLAALVAGKYTESMPLYRMEAYYQRHGVDLDRQSLARWMIGAAACRTGHRPAPRPAVDPLGPPCRRNAHPGAQGSRTGGEDQVGHWVYASGGTDPPIRLYAYQPTRGSEHPRRFLDGFAGYLQSDGFAGYDALARANPTITGVGCWAHARRKFIDVTKAQQTNDADSEAAWFIDRISALYALERAVADAEPGERYRRRQDEARPILDDIGHRLERVSSRVLPKSLLGKAITYARKQ